VSDSPQSKQKQHLNIITTPLNTTTSHLVPPHGGELINLLLKPEYAAALQATADARAAPHLVPVCYALAGEALYITIDEKPKRRDVPLKRVRNILENPQTAFVVRCIGDDSEPRIFSTWGCKALAAIGKLPDTVMDRSIEIRLRRALPGEVAEKIRHASPRQIRASIATGRTMGR